MTRGMERPAAATPATALSGMERPAAVTPASTLSGIASAPPAAHTTHGPPPATRTARRISHTRGKT